jgi:hypothetical protein
MRREERKKGQANQDDMSLLNSLISLKAEIDQSTRRSVERKRSTNSFQTLLSAVVIDVNKDVVSRGGRKERWGLADRAAAEARLTYRIDSTAPRGLVQLLSLHISPHAILNERRGEERRGGEDLSTKFSQACWLLQSLAISVTGVLEKRGASEKSREAKKGMWTSRYWFMSSLCEWLSWKCTPTRLSWLRSIHLWDTQRDREGETERDRERQRETEEVWERERERETERDGEEVWERERKRRRN